MNYRHFSGFNDESVFRKLSGDIQRAIETQANIDLEANKLSKYHGKQLKDDEIAEKLFNDICEEYACKDKKELQKLVILDSKALYYFPLTKDRLEYWESKAIEKAQSIDNNIKVHMADHFKNFSR